MSLDALQADQQSLNINSTIELLKSLACIDQIQALSMSELSSQISILSPQFLTAKKWPLFQSDEDPSLFTKSSYPLFYIPSFLQELPNDDWSVVETHFSNTSRTAVVSQLKTYMEFLQNTPRAEIDSVVIVTEEKVQKAIH